MFIESIFNKKKYVRKIECMGTGLILFKIETMERRIGQNFHLFFEDHRKPPLDIAIDPNDGTIEYISYFIQNELIVKKEIKNKTQQKNGGVRIVNNDFNERNVHITEFGEFIFYIYKNDIWILRKGINNDMFIEYSFDELNGILFIDDNFCGLVLRELSKEEIDQIDSSKCLD